MTRSAVFRWAVAVCAVLALPLMAQAEEQRFKITGTELFYASDVVEPGFSDDITFEDRDRLRALLRAHDHVEKLVFNSSGGGFYAANAIADLVIDFALDTQVQDRCESSCVTIFLAGQNRTMAPGGRIGFHQVRWSASSIEEYFAANQEEENWETPFDFAAWMYLDTQTETYTRLMYMLSRGVDPAFAIRTIRKPDTGMWYPNRAVLLSAGVLTQ
ncbi:MAG: hypothetical protein AAF755_04245 [Pseudomonadota bacterium]